MSHAPAAAKFAARPASAIEAWLYGDPELDDEGLALLAAYRDAVDSQRHSTAVASNAADVAEPPAEMEMRHQKPATGVLRLDSVAGVSPERFSGLHGQLLAAGFLIADVVGRSDGLSYRVTREGLQRLSNETPAEAA